MLHHVSAQYIAVHDIVIVHCIHDMNAFVPACMNARLHEYARTYALTRTHREVNPQGHAFMLTFEQAHVQLQCFSKQRTHNKSIM